MHVLEVGACALVFIGLLTFIVAGSLRSHTLLTISIFPFAMGGMIFYVANLEQTITYHLAWVGIAVFGAIIFWLMLRSTNNQQ